MLEEVKKNADRKGLKVDTFITFLISIIFSSTLVLNCDKFP